MSVIVANVSCDIASNFKYKLRQFYCAAITYGDHMPVDEDMAGDRLVGLRSRARGTRVNLTQHVVHCFTLYLVYQML